MRATRAFVGAFGAGISLAMAGSLALLLVSSVIAFRGWPDDLAGSAVPDAAELSKPSPRATAAEAVAVALPPALSSTSPALIGRARGETSVAGANAGQAGQAAVDPGADAVVREPADPAAGSATGTPSSPLDAKGDPVQSITNSVTGATQTVTETVAPVVSGALESVGAGGPDGKSGSVAGTVTQTVVELLP